MRWCNWSKRSNKRRTEKKTALIRKCCMHLSSLSTFSKHYRLPVLKRIYTHTHTHIHKWEIN